MRAAAVQSRGPQFGWRVRWLHRETTFGAASFFHDPDMNRATMIAAVSLGMLWQMALNAQDSAFRIEIQRKYNGADCVSGYLLINGKVACYVLERPWANNAPQISSIPKGEYSATIRDDGKLGWRIELIGVPGRNNIQLHIGNTIADSTGCLLPGEDIAGSLCTVSKSGAALEKLRTSLAEWQEKLKQSVPIKVKVSGM